MEIDIRDAKVDEKFEISFDGPFYSGFWFGPKYDEENFEIVDFTNYDVKSKLESIVNYRYEINPKKKGRFEIDFGSRGGVQGSIVTSYYHLSLDVE